jgi:hypothetical protein
MNFCCLYSYYVEDDAVISTMTGIREMDFILVLKKIWKRCKELLDFKHH